MDTLNRIFAEQRGKCANCGMFHHATLIKNNCRIAREERTVAQLKEILDPTMRHSRKTPKREHGLIVVVSVVDHYHIIDGSNRVNKLISGNDNSPHDVIVLTYVPESM
jgi:hypothetical protein